MAKKRSNKRQMVSKAPIKSHEKPVLSIHESPDTYGNGVGEVNGVTIPTCVFVVGMLPGFAGRHLMAVSRKVDHTKIRADISGNKNQIISINELSEIQKKVNEFFSGISILQETNKLEIVEETKEQCIQNDKFAEDLVEKKEEVVTIIDINDEEVNEKNEETSIKLERTYLFNEVYSFFENNPFVTQNKLKKKVKIRRRTFNFGNLKFIWGIE